MQKVWALTYSKILGLFKYYFYIDFYQKKSNKAADTLAYIPQKNYKKKANVEPENV